VTTWNESDRRMMPASTIAILEGVLFDERETIFS
jgi:hypothetical protein